MEPHSVPPRLPRLILSLGVRLAPRRRRVELRRLWEAEQAHRWQRTRARRPWAGFALALWTTGVFRHALEMRRREGMMGGWMVDARQAVRALRKRPGTTALAIGLLAVGIGAAAAVFSLVASAFLEPLPLPEGDRLVRIYGENPAAGIERSTVSWADAQDFLRTPVLASGAVYGPAVAGVYGLVAFSVARRRREIGIRMAVGASGDAIRRLVLREGLVLALAGLGLGTGLGLLFARGLSSSLTGVGWLDPATWLGAAGALLAATLLATAVPAWRATRVDPARTLNAE